MNESARKIKGEMTTVSLSCVKLECKIRTTSINVNRNDMKFSGGDWRKMKVKYIPGRGKS